MLQVWILVFSSCNTLQPVVALVFAFNNPITFPQDFMQISEDTRVPVVQLVSFT